jgi:hypothetical protein
MMDVSEYPILVFFSSMNSMKKLLNVELGIPFSILEI